MKRLHFLPILALALGTMAACARDYTHPTLYLALDYDRKAHGPTALDHVLLIQGEGGSPQPHEWILYRGTVNPSDFHITGILSDGRILYGSVPTTGVPLPVHPEPLDFTQLNMDSNAAFHIAEREALREGFTFNRIDYLLRTNTIAQVPAYTLTMYNENKRLLAEMTISANDGTTLYPVSIHSYVVETINGREVAVRTPEPFWKKAARSVNHWFSQTGLLYGRDLLRSASTTEEILNDHRTLNDDIDDR